MIQWLLFFLENLHYRSFHLRLIDAVMLTSAAKVHLMLPDVDVSPDSLRKKPILLNGSSIHSIDFPTILQKLKAACRLWKSCIRLVLVSTWGRPSREQRSSSFSCETTKTINPVPERKRKHTATLCSTTLLHLIFQSLPHRQELDPAKSTCECVWPAWSKSQKLISYPLAPLSPLESTVIGQIEA